jgi:hypothetical protein
MVSLPSAQLPSSAYRKYCLKGEKNLPLFFKYLGLDEKEKEKMEEFKQEPRIMTQVLKSMQEQIDAHKQKMGDNNAEEINGDVLDGLALEKFDKDEDPKGNRSLFNSRLY